MLKFKIRALIYAIRELKYETIASFRTNYRNRLISQLIENTHIHSEVIYAVFKKLGKQELKALVTDYCKCEPASEVKKRLGLIDGQYMATMLKCYGED